MTAEIVAPQPTVITAMGFEFVPLAQIEADIAAKKTLILQHVHGKTAGVGIARPSRSRESGELLTGQKVFTPEEAREQILVVDQFTRKALMHDMHINLASPLWQIHWRWIARCGLVAYREDVARSNMFPDVVFYVANEELVIDERVSKRNLRLKALNMVAEAPRGKWLDVMRLLGDNGSEYDHAALQDYLQTIAEADPQKLINTFNDPDQDTKLFYYQLKDARPKVITTTAEGIVKYGNITMGLNEAMAIEFLKNPANGDIVRQMYAQIVRKETAKSQALLDIEADRRRRQEQEEQQQQQEAEIERRVQEKLAQIQSSVDKPPLVITSPNEITVNTTGNAPGVPAITAETAPALTNPPTLAGDTQPELALQPVKRPVPANFLKKTAPPDDK